MIYQETTAVSPVTVAEAKSYMRVYHDLDDALIAELLVTATQEAEHRMQREIIFRRDPLALAFDVASVPPSVKAFVYGSTDTLYRFRGQYGEADLKNYAPHLLDPFVCYNRDADEQSAEDSK